MAKVRKRGSRWVVLNSRGRKVGSAKTKRRAKQTAKKKR